jgi:hypothetical protein
VCALLFSGSVALAQFENGSVVGTIRDSSGAPIPNATVKITSVDTGIVSQTTSNGTGEYDLPSIRVGRYNVEASASGFSDAVAKNITVSVGTRQHIDLSLKVGTAETTVEVSDVALQLDTESSQRQQVITNQQAEGLPALNRNYGDLLGLVTGVRQAPTAASTTSNLNAAIRASAYNVNGQRSVFNNFMLDGMDNNAYGESNQGFDNQIIAVPPDSVAQFSVVTNNESAEYGRSSGATINVASLSGTNQYHATLYEFLRNTALNAPGFFKPSVTGTFGLVPFRKPTLNRNQFGMNFGGPIVKDHLFFFLDYEGLRYVSKPLFVLTLPTQNELNGILTVPVRNAVTGTVYPAGTPIPTGGINPLSQQILQAYHNIAGCGGSGGGGVAYPTTCVLPVAGSASTGIDVGDYSVQIPFTDNGDKGDLRLDYAPNDKSRYFLRVSDRKETETNFPTIPLPLEGQTSGPQRILDQQVAAGYTRFFGSNKILDLRLGLSRTKAGKTPLSAGTASFGIPGLPTAPNLVGGLPAIGISGGFTSFGRQTTNPQFQNPALLDPKVNYTWVLGNHSIKVGYEFEKVWMGVLDNNPLYGSFTYSGGYSACPVGTVLPGGGVCSSAAGTAPALSSSKVADTYWADFLFGTTFSYSLANVFEAHLRQTLQSGYAQDDWKVNSQLTLNLGLRWEYGSPYSEQNNYISNFDPGSQTVFTTSPGATAGNGITPVSYGGTYGKTLVNPDLNDFAPRFGFAFAATPKTAVRGGFGISYVHYTRAGSGDITAINAPQAQFATVTQITPTATPSNHCTTPLPAQIITPGTTTPSCYATSDQGFPSGLVTIFNKATDNITWVPANTRDSYVESYYLSVQRQLSKNTLLDIAYVGNHSLKLQGFINGNQKNPSLGFARPYANWPSDITEALNEFYGNYNSLQVRYEARMVEGLTLLNSFTWEHSLDNASASLEGNTPAPQDGNNLRADYAQSDYNLPLANVTSLVYDLPFGHNRRFMSNTNGIVDGAIGGWQLSLINTAQAGTPFNITYGPNSAQAVSPQISANYRGANAYRPDRVPGVPLTQGTGNRQAGTGYVNYLNPAAYLLPPITDSSGNTLSPFGTLGRNPVRTPTLNETDLDLNKKFSTPIQRLKVEFRAEFYNLFNHTNYYLASGAVSGTQGTAFGTYGVGGSAPVGNFSAGALNANVGQISSTFTPRVVQFGLKLLY